MTQRSGTDFLQLDPALAPAKGITTWLADAMRSAITDGRLAAGTVLPATRVLAADLGISRGVIVEAYQRLTDEGLVAGRHGTGTVVLATTAGRARRRTRPVTPMLLPRPASTGIDLSPGVPDLSAFPRAAWLRAERTVLAHAAAADFGYGDPRGHPWLRRELAGWLMRLRGLRTDAEDIVIVAGVAQSLALLAQGLRSRGSTSVAVEDPGSRGARDELIHWGIRPVPIPVDDDGLRVDDLTRSGERTVLVTPAHEFPTGVVLAPPRRRALLDWAAAADDALVIEDDYDAEYRYDRAPVPALHASAPDRIAYTGSTSKTLAPGLRLGWLIPPGHLHPDVVAAKHASDLGSSTIIQLVLAQLLASGDYDRHIRLVRARYRQRRDALLAALGEHLPAARVQGVAAGLHLMVTLPHLDPGADVELADRIRQAGVSVHPLSWHRASTGPAGLVLGYAANPPDRLRQAARIIAGAVAPRS
jgi:GntR family transcriptional regulator/MocR family aminotransferase